MNIAKKRTRQENPCHHDRADGRDGDQRNAPGRQALNEGERMVGVAVMVGATGMVGVAVGLAGGAAAQTTGPIRP